MRVSLILSVVSAFIATSLAASCDASNAIDVTPYLDQLSSGSGGGASNIDPDYLYRIIGTAVKRRIVKRATLDCAGAESCVALQGYPLCFDGLAWTWRDAEGNHGNLQDGSYTLADGRQGNLYTGPYPLPDGGTAPAPTATGGGSSPATTIGSTPVSTPASSVTGMDESSSAQAGPTDAPTTAVSESKTTSAPSSTQTPNGGIKIGASLGFVFAAAGGALAIL
ncbi:hypothetical protein H072_3070 [Dactylellina haptotyla CBS 200.50]|uniref:Uncharacterized protein n=1 Tax=Dactylellina haptotyla (strain CBS 200.50) TaxID=1284197 RepID=S8AJ64_DACHA|nr:hypothetical protein H072_3070 [Dactylellina haptotyla CBS 200.50]